VCTTLCTPGPAPSYAVISNDKTHVYAVNEIEPEGTISSFSLNAKSDGALLAINTLPSHGGMISDDEPHHSHGLHGNPLFSLLPPAFCVCVFNHLGWPCHITSSRNGKWILTSNYSSGTVAINPVNEKDGSLEEVLFQTRLFQQEIRLIAASISECRLKLIFSLMCACIMQATSVLCPGGKDGHAHQAVFNKAGQTLNAHDLLMHEHCISMID
jgi:hypothetical protein